MQTYDEWFEELNNMFFDDYAVHLYDVPDYNYMELYEQNMLPEEAFLEMEDDDDFMDNICYFDGS